MHTMGKRSQKRKGEKWMRSAVRMSLFAGQERREKLDGIGDPLAAMESR